MGLHHEMGSSMHLCTKHKHHSAITHPPAPKSKSNPITQEQTNKRLCFQQGMCLTRWLRTFFRSSTCQYGFPNWNKDMFVSCTVSGSVKDKLLSTVALLKEKIRQKKKLQKKINAITRKQKTDFYIFSRESAYLIHNCLCELRLIIIIVRSAYALRI